MKFPKIFISVGTTEFNNLIKKTSDPEIYKILKEHLGCEDLKIQIGRGEKIDFSHFNGIKVEVFDLKDSIAGDIDAADLVRKPWLSCVIHQAYLNKCLQIISHAGAGTCIDVLSRGKPLIVVINDTLMNNHQIELAEQLSNDNYLFYTTVNKLSETLKSFDVAKLKKYEKGNVDKFIEYLDNAMGFVW